MVVAVKGGVVKAVESVVVEDLLVRKFVLKDDLNYHFIAEAACEHEGRDTVACHRKVHVDVSV